MADENEEIEDENAEAEDGEDGEGKKKKPGLMKLGLFIGLPVIILALGGTAAFLLLSGGGDEAELAEAGEHGEEAAGEHGAGPAEEEMTLVELPEMQVSISNGNGGFSILQMQLVFETPDEHFAEHFSETEQNRIRDQFVAFLRELRPEDLAGSAGYQRVRMELLRRSQLVLGDDRVHAVLITNMLIV
ncbi:flagellar basal body-associated FliL family protein [Hyphobacterium sp.]|uniref:flagellar basal body-associated FliL family protein n=1 Tax=Hyphobacterium sp. TaxID=2004662 RepID=UPI003BAC0BA9